jgi:hypothetical protein
VPLNIQGLSPDDIALDVPDQILLDSQQTQPLAMVSEEEPEEEEDEAKALFQNDMPEESMLTLWLSPEPVAKSIADLDPIQSLPDMADDPLHTWYNAARNVQSSLHVILQKSNEFYNHNVELMQRSYMASLAVPVLLGTMAWRAKRFLDDIGERLRGDAARSLSKVEFSAHLLQLYHYDGTTNKQKTWLFRFELGDLPTSLATGLQMINDHLDLGVTIGKVSTVLTNELMLMCTDSAAKETWVEPVLIAEWIADRVRAQPTSASKEKLQAQILKSKPSLQGITQNESALIKEFAPKPVMLSSTAPLEISDEESRGPEALAVVDEESNATRTYISLVDAEASRTPLRAPFDDVSEAIRAFIESATLDVGSTGLLESQRDMDLIYFAGKREAYDFLLKLCKTTPNLLDNPTFIHRMKSAVEPKVELLLMDVVNTTKQKPDFNKNITRFTDWIEAYATRNDPTRKQLWSALFGENLGKAMQQWMVTERERKSKEPRAVTDRYEVMLFYLLLNGTELNAKQFGSVEPEELLRWLIAKCGQWYGQTL